MDKGALLYDKFLDEYVSESAVRKYTTETAGYGISYLLRKDYARIYMDVINKYFQAPKQRPLRLLEFGCGGGMNIIRLVSLLTEKRIPVECAFGTDFSPRLVMAAKEEAKAALPPQTAGKMHFYVARNEQLVEDLLTGLSGNRKQLGEFDLIIGVNTFRYCHRLGKQVDCAMDIYQLLRAGGVCVNIDMNNRFPAFRSRLRRSDNGAPECYLPSLEEYASPFATAGFEILKKGNFCWVPHSASRSLTTACRVAAPFLNTLVRSRAMRSLVVARKPA